jgi:F0F1-type ATP synthase delta subunit
MIIFIVNSLAHKQANMLEKVEGELQAVKQTMKAIPNFASFLENPTIAKDAKTKRVRTYH